ncbi:MAG: hypothetical protein RMI91_00850 [Gemmatales bacterium]|nr:hypothetical protein [Gemmatales bacterium]
MLTAKIESFLEPVHQQLVEWAAPDSTPFPQACDRRTNLSAATQPQTVNNFP